MKKKVISLMVVFAMVMTFVPTSMFTVAHAAESWGMPLSSGTITSFFGNRNLQISGASTNHQGMDIASYSGDAVLAVRSGYMVVKNTSCSHNYGKSNAVDPCCIEGNWVVIDHQDGTYSAYKHLGSVKGSNRWVNKGEVIGYEGSTGSSTGAHLHFEVRTGARDWAGRYYELKAVNPEDYYMDWDITKPNTYPSYPDWFGNTYGHNGKNIVGGHFGTYYVMFIQSGLKTLGYSLDVDGSFGPGTAATVKQFQQNNGLVADGEFGSASWNKMVALLKAKYPDVKAPTQATLSINKTEFVEGETVTFNFSGNNNTTTFTLGIDKNGSGRVITQNTSNSSYSTSTLSAGKYSAYVTAGNSAGIADSSRIYFTVYSKTHTIKYDANGGSGAPADQTVNHNQTSKLSSTKPTRSGYDFKGWSTSKTATSATYAAGGSLTTKTDVTLYAVWSKVTLTSISVKSNPSKTTYTVGDTLNTSGLALTAKYSDGSTQTVNSGYTCSPTSLTKAGKQTITVSYGGKTTSFTVTVNEKASSTKTPTITVGSVTGSAGSTVSVPITLSNNPGIAAMRLEIAFDTSRLELTGVEYNSAISGIFFGPTDNEGFSGNKSPITLIWSTGTVDYSGNEQFATLQFKVLKNAKEGKASITLVDSEFDNKKEQEVSFKVTNGYVNVASYIPGDVNSDGSVNNKDVIRLLQYLAKWDVEVNEAAKDINGDGSVNNKDVIRLLQYLAKWDVQIY